MSLTTLFVDMNAYFASAEQQRRPELRGRPVAVAAVDVDSTCCIAASYEAKAYGIKTGTPVWEAKRRCPSLRVVEADPPYYVRLHHRILAAASACLPVRAVLSIDEFTCRLIGDERRPARAEALARRMKAEIGRRAGQCMRCSVGVAPNRFLAKVAADMRKPDGLVVLAAEDLPHALYPLDLADLPGVGPNMLRRLHGHGIRTTEQICRAAAAELRGVWGGVTGEWLWHWLRGHDVEPPPTRRRSVGHSHVLPPALRTDDGAFAVLVRLVHKAAARLRAIGYWARSMEVYASFTFREEGWKARAPLGLCQDTLSMVRALADVWRHRPPGRPTQVAVTLLDLVADGYAPRPLFPAERGLVRLARAMDSINHKFGPDTVYFAAMHDARASAPTRIAFTHIPDFGREGP